MSSYYSLSHTSSSVIHCQSVWYYSLAKTLPYFISTSHSRPVESLTHSSVIHCLSVWYYSLAKTLPYFISTCHSRPVESLTHFSVIHCQSVWYNSLAKPSLILYPQATADLWKASPTPLWFIVSQCDTIAWQKPLLYIHKPQQTCGKPHPLLCDSLSVSVIL